MLIFSLYLLSDKQNLQFYYLIGFVINSILNLILKGIIRQPRPCDDEKNFNIALKNIPETIFKDGVPFNIFGMPSGHAQSALYSTTYIFLSLKNIKVLLFYVFLSIIIVLQRIMKQFHTVFQVVVGLFIGSFMGYVAFNFAEIVLKGRIREKRDDFGPI
jgi:membrane-associated phospholipid phosphatase